MDAMDEMHLKEEELFIEDEDIRVMNSLELIPVVYTTRLDDMAVLKRPTGLHPNEITDRILKESKPELFDYPSPDQGPRNQKSFYAVKAKLNKIYKNNNNLHQKLEIKPDTSKLHIKDEVTGEANTSCKYSELLKLCKPFSIVLSKCCELPTSKSKVMKNDEDLLLIEVNDLVTVISSSDEDEPLIKLTDPIRMTKNNEPNLNNPVMSKSKEPNSKLINTAVTPPLKQKNKPKQSFLNVTGNRVLLNGLMEMHDLYSKEFYLYVTDSDGLLIDYYKDKIENANKYEHIHSNVETRLTFLNCCWAQRDEYIQTMYPRMLTYTNFRFMKKQHMCPLGTCVCCCRNKEEFTKPSLILTHTDDSSSVNPPPYLKEDIEIQALEDEIEKSILRMNKAPRLNTTELLRPLLSKSNAKPSGSDCGRVSLIERALSYEKPSQKKQTVNRQLITINKESLQYNVLIFRNFATDVREVYELNSSGELQSYMKLTCFSNTSRPDIKKLMLAPSAAKSVKDVCCWFKREQFVTELLDAKVLQPSAAKFIRSRHMCMAESCTCCCKLTNKKGVKLTDVTNPSRPNYWSVVQKIVKSDAIQSDNNDLLPLVSDTGVSKVIRPGVNNIHGPVASSSTAAKDCKITFVSPQTSPATPNLLPPDQMDHIADMVKGHAMTGEVNMMITSILEKFKDVRLTINSDGKVSAAMDIPIHTLTTIELKVLAKILSYAQSQINLLGLHSGMSLSSIMNMKKNDQNSATVNNPQSSTLQPPQALGNPKPFPQMKQPPTKEAAYEFFSKSMSDRNKGFNDSFTSFLSKKITSPDTQKMVTPVIQNVFSLKNEDIDDTKDNTSSTALWYRKPAAQQLAAQNKSPVGSTKKYANILKRSQKTDSTEPKRIRVVSPSKLSAPATNENKTCINTFYKPMPLLNSHNLSGGHIPGVPLLSNPNFLVVVTPKSPNAQPSASKAVPTSAPAAPTTSFSERTMVVTPLTTMAAINSNEKHATVPISVNPSVATAASVDTITKPEAPPVVAVDDDIEDDDDCILGM